MASQFGVILLVAPGEENVARACDTLESLDAFEKGNFFLVLVDDALKSRNLAGQIAPQSARRVIEILNPRRGRGSGWEAGAAAGVLAALKETTRLTGIDFVLKIDTDSLVISPFSERITSRFREKREVGLLGYYPVDQSYLPDGTSKFAAAPALEKLVRQFTVWRRTPAKGGPTIQIGFLGRYGRIRAIIRKALLVGYRLGEHCNGGGYALSWEALVRMNQAKMFDDPCLWLRTPCCCDIVVALCARAAGMKIEDFSADGEPFGVKHLGLPDLPERLLERGFSVIHSIKDYGDQREADTRQFFRQLRNKYQSI